MKEGDQVSVKIIRIDPERRRMGLSLKQAEGEVDWHEYQSAQEINEVEGEEVNEVEEETVPNND